ncbi:MAG TPA: hypothetical protein VKB69_05110 [Micromonosporaceae bacterium]|nr:hypothetical protein [Micromonosporaceae bacterium]
MTFEDDVRDTLLAHADDAPSGAGTLDAVRARERRLRTHRVGVAAAVTVLAVATAVTVPYALSSGRHGSGNIPAGAGTVAVHPTSPSNTQSTKPATVKPSAVPSHASRVPLEPATFAMVKFPLTPTNTPPGLGAPTVGRDAGPDIRLVYLADEQNTYMVANVGARKPLDLAKGSAEHTTIRGHAATIYTDGLTISILWQLDDGKWVSVEAHGSFTKAQIKQYAVGLEETPMPAPALPFNVAKAPHGYQVAFQEIDRGESGTEFYFSLGPPSHLTDESPTWLGLQHTAHSGDPMGGDPVQVGPDPGFLIHDGEGVTLQVLRPGFAFTVGESTDGPLSDSDLINYAIGITLS